MAEARTDVYKRQELQASGSSQSGDGRRDHGKYLCFLDAIYFHIEDRHNLGATEMQDVYKRQPLNGSRLCHCKTDLIMPACKSD